MMNNRNRVGMPQTHQILKYWREVMLISKIIYEPIPDRCMACGATSVIERAHIKALIDGGNNHPSNIHLLCKTCHVISEMLDGYEYWLWLEYKQKNEYDLTGESHLMSLAYAKGLVDIDGKVPGERNARLLKEVFCNE